MLFPPVNSANEIIKYLAEDCSVYGSSKAGSNHWTFFPIT